MKNNLLLPVPITVCFSACAETLVLPENIVETED